MCSVFLYLLEMFIGWATMFVDGSAVTKTTYLMKIA